MVLWSKAHHTPLFCCEVGPLDKYYVVWAFVPVDQTSYKPQLVVLAEDQHQESQTHTLNRFLSVRMNYYTSRTERA